MTGLLFVVFYLYICLLCSFDFPRCCGINANLFFFFYRLSCKMFYVCFKKDCAETIQGDDIIERQSCRLCFSEFRLLLCVCHFCPICSVCCLHPSPLLCLLRKMTFGKVNEMGQFIREAEPEPDVKKSKGTIRSLFYLYLSHYPLCIFALTLSRFISHFVYSVPMDIKLIWWLPPVSLKLS